MGAVYKVRHRLLGETRVIKTLNARLSNDKDSQIRLQREAQAATRLYHPNIVRVFDLTLDDVGSAYIVMEFLDGFTLRAWLDAHGPLPIGLALEVTDQALGALSFLHTQGFVHRDISPDNFMLVKDGNGRPETKLLDLGVVKGGAEARMTAGGVFLGKFYYASPEHFTDGASKLDARSDLYSFGVMLYELLTGELAIPGRTMPDLMHGHIAKAPIPFDRLDPKRRIPGGLREATLKALEKDPNDRFHSASQFLEAILPLKAHHPLDVAGWQQSFTRAPDLLATTVPMKTGSTQFRLDAQFGLGITPTARALPVDDAETTAPLPILRNESDTTAILPKQSEIEVTAVLPTRGGAEPNADPPEATAPLPIRNEIETTARLPTKSLLAGFRPDAPTPPAGSDPTKTPLPFPATASASTPPAGTEDQTEGITRPLEKANTSTLENSAGLVPPLPAQAPPIPIPEPRVEAPEPELARSPPLPDRNVGARRSRDMASELQSLATEAGLQFTRMMKKTRAWSQRQWNQRLAPLASTARLQLDRLAENIRIGSRRWGSLSPKKQRSWMIGLVISGIGSVLLLSAVIPDHSQPPPEPEPPPPPQVAPPQPAPPPEPAIRDELTEAENALDEQDYELASELLEALKEDFSMGPEERALWTELQLELESEWQAALEKQELEELPDQLREALAKGRGKRVSQLVEAIEKAQASDPGIFDSIADELKRAKEIKSRYHAMWSAADGDDLFLQLKTSLALLQTLPNYRQAQKRRETAVSEILNRASLQSHAGDPDKALDTLERLRNIYPEAPEVTQRISSLKDFRAELTRQQDLLLRAQRIGEESPLEGLRLLERAKPLPQLEAEFEALKSELQDMEERRDREGPVIALRSVQHTRGASFELRVLIEDASPIATAHAWVKLGKRGDFKKMRLSETRDGDFQLEISPRSHDDVKWIYFFVEAVDSKGNSGNFYSRREPYSVRRQR